MYKCTISKHVYTDSSKTKLIESLQAVVEIPFPPYIGLNIVEDPFCSGEITQVQWDNKTQEFHASTADECPDSDLATPDEVVKSLLHSNGWKRIKDIAYDDPLIKEIAELRELDLDKNPAARILFDVLEESGTTVTTNQAKQLIKVIRESLEDKPK